MRRHTFRWGTRKPGCRYRIECRFILASVTDGQTDRRTDSKQYRNVYMPRACSECHAVCGVVVGGCWSVSDNANIDKSHEWRWQNRRHQSGLSRSRRDATPVFISSSAAADGALSCSSKSVSGRQYGPLYGSQQDVQYVVDLIDHWSAGKLTGRRRELGGALIRCAINQV